VSPYSPAARPLAIVRMAAAVGAGADEGAQAAETTTTENATTA
jgi:hypothetical protein